MRRAAFICCIALAAGTTACGRRAVPAGEEPTPAGAPATEYAGYELVWADEFDEPGRPAAHWSYEQGFVRNRELQWYQPDNATVENGCLVITGRRETVVNPLYDPESRDWRRERPQAEFTSSCVTTRESFAFRYGRLEVRARIPVARGAWPAIWTLGNRWGWPANGEVDVMEFYRRAQAAPPGGEKREAAEAGPEIPIILANACWMGPDGRDAWDEGTVPFAHFLELNPRWASKFHLWRMDWDADFIRIWLDGELMNEIDLGQADCGGGANRDVNPFSNDVEDFGHYILLNLALGGHGGEPDIEAFPLRYEVDFVRVYRAAE